MENKRSQRLEKLKIGVMKYCDELLKIANELERKNPNAERYYDIWKIHCNRDMILMMIDIDDSGELKAFESRQKKLKKKRDKEAKPAYEFRPANAEGLVPIYDDDDLPF